MVRSRPVFRATAVKAAQDGGEEDYLCPSVFICGFFHGSPPSLQDQPVNAVIHSS